MLNKLIYINMCNVLIKPIKIYIDAIKNDKVYLYIRLISIFIFYIYILD